jgi:hypothetical protein
VPNDVFDDELDNARVVPYRTVEFALMSVNQEIAADWFVIEPFCTEEITGAGVGFCSVKKLYVPFVEQFP